MENIRRGSLYNQLTGGNSASVNQSRNSKVQNRIKKFEDWNRNGTITEDEIVGDEVPTTNLKSDDSTAQPNETPQMIEETKDQHKRLPNPGEQSVTRPQVDRKSSKLDDGRRKMGSKIGQQRKEN